MKFKTTRVGNNGDSKLQRPLYNRVPNLGKRYWDSHTIVPIFKKNNCSHILPLKSCFLNTLDVML